MKVWLWTIGSVIVISLISLIGAATLSLNKTKLRAMLLFMVSFAVGGLFGDAFIHLLPQSFEALGANLKTSLYILGGIFIFFILEKFIRWRHCHIPTSREHIHPVATLNIIGDGVHNMLDGMIVAASFAVSVPIGIATALAVILHEIPQEIGDFGILVYSGMSVKKALFFNFLSALTAVVGAVIALTLESRIKGFLTYLLPITAGGFLYIGGSDLIPELHKEDHVKISTSLVQLAAIMLGIGMMALLVFVE
ncbi:MAG: ZIP family metal transporter [Candidatus Omnitrophica bacterium CG22_combo_CG10-13_8_21_14_all_43_16]|nr:MAG: ZIP family metal transporter [Candidatus Omnitrophica bacterium CG22_combo_CG10-13_8_21_14_all_43_16]